MLGRRLLTVVFLIAVVLAVFVVTAKRTAPNGERGGEETSMATLSTLTLSSPAFSEGDLIPSRYTCDGEDLMPPIEVRGIPQNTQTLAIIMDDPDAPSGTWDHLVVFNIPVTGDSFSIKEGAVPRGTDGKNSWGKTGYGGPCPPSGTHRYIFRVYALGTKLAIPSGSTKEVVEKAMEDHVLAEGKLAGQYRRE